MLPSPFEVWKDPATGTEFCFSHSDKNLTTGVMFLPPGAELPKHNRPKAFENLIQITGKCKIAVFNGDGTFFEKILSPGDSLRMEKGQYHIHSNPFEDKSHTLFKAVGDITEIMDVLRKNFTRVDS